MATALYRRYRSARFADLVGQEVIATTLRNEVRNASLAHAYLFSGIRGTGKTSTARILARAVNCLDLHDGEPCNACTACVEVTEGTSVDVLEIDAASNRGIDEMRDLREKVRYLPASLRTKVYIIDEAHMLTTEAWNAFLKTLEEPPPHVLFVLATTEPHKVPETVRSRVQRFDFRRVSASDIATHLAGIVRSEQVAAEADALALVARAAQGSMRDALSMLDQAMAGGERPVTAAVVRRALGVADPETMRALLHALAGADGAAALRSVAVAFDTGADPRQLLREASRLARAAQFAALGHVAGADVTPEEAELATLLARVAPAGFWLRALERFQGTELELRQPVDARLQLEFCVMALVTESRSGAAALADLEARVARLESVGGSGAAGQVTRAAPAAAVGRDEPPAAPRTEAAHIAAAPATSTAALGSDPNGDSTAAAAQEPSVAGSQSPREGPVLDTAAAWQQHWPALLDAVNRRDRALAGVLRDCRAVEATAASLTVGAPYNFHLDRLNERSRLALLAEAATEVAGSPRSVETRFVGEGGAPARRPGATGEATQAILDTFAGSRVTSTRLRDDPGRTTRGAP